MTGFAPPLELWRIFLEIAPAAVAILDRDMRYLAVSRRWCLDYQLVGRDLLGHSHYEVFPDLAERWREIHRRCLAGATERSEADEFLRPDGRTGWLRWEICPWHRTDHEVGGIVIFSEDITERKQTEERLRTSEMRLNSAIRGPGVGIAEQDLGLRYTYIDVVFGDHRYGGTLLRAELFAGKTDYEIYGPDHEFIPAKLSVIATGIGIHREMLFPVDNGEILFEVWVEPRRDAGGEIVGVLCSFIDITERRRLELQLRQAQKMEAIGTLTGGMAHDFNNILAVIIGNIDELQSRGGLDAEAAELAGEALSAAERGADLTHRLLAFARQQPLAPQRVEPNSLVRELTKLFRRTLGESIEITLDLASDAKPVIVDPTQLEAAILNLATNARDAMPVGGTLAIVTGNRHLDEDYARHALDLTPGDYVMIEVTDTGTGIPPEEVRRIFEPFFTTKEPGRGTGLGLAMVFGFMKQSGGHINVYSEPGRGTTMRLYLPPATAEASTDPPVPIVQIARGAGQTILSVEDNDELRSLVTRQITGLGYRVVEAATGAEALAAMEAGPVDLVMTDVVMPGGIDGVELIQQILARWPKTKAILTSGYPEAKLNGHSRPKLPGVRLLTKPYRREDLAHALQEALGTK
jgi:two-component system cell cycle sensor histidine kinase/response regulator CckA